MSNNTCEVLVIGEGLSGIVAAAAAAAQGSRVMLVSKGPGSFVLGSGCIDLDGIAAEKLGMSDGKAEDALGFFLSLAASVDVGYEGGADERRWVPTIYGTFQQVSAAPRSLWVADPRTCSKFLIVGIANLSGFDAHFLAERLSLQSEQMGWKTSFRAEVVSLGDSPRHALTALEIATRLDREPAYRDTIAKALRSMARDAEVLIIPGILGIKSNDVDFTCFEEEVGCSVCEVATLPPSIPGLRLLQRLERRLAESGVEISTGFAVRRLCADGNRCVAVELETPGRPRRLPADAFVLACGRYTQLTSEPAEAPFHPTSLVNVISCGSLQAEADPRHRNAISILTGHHAGLLVREQGVQYAGR